MPTKHETPKYVSFRFNMDPTIHKKAKLKALLTDTTIAKVLRKYLEKWVEEEHPIILDSAITPTEEKEQA